jgi:hypothetical protein
MDQEGEVSKAFLLSGRFSFVEGNGEAKCGQMRRQEIGEARFPVADEGENDGVEVGESITVFGVEEAV